jgi:hypothetical protein
MHLKLLNFKVQANSLAVVDQAAKARVIYKTSHVFFTNQQKLEDTDNLDERTLHFSQDVTSYLNNNIITTLNQTQAIAMQESLHCSSLACLKSYQAKLTKHFTAFNPTTFTLS